MHSINRKLLSLLLLATPALAQDVETDAVAPRPAVMAPLAAWFALQTFFATTGELLGAGRVGVECDDLFGVLLERDELEVLGRRLGDGHADPAQVAGCQRRTAASPAAGNKAASSPLPPAMRRRFRSCERR